MATASTCSPISRAPIASALLVLAALMITGSPPFGLFFSEMTILKAGFASPHVKASSVFLAALVILFCGVAFQIGRLVLGPPRDTSDRRVPFLHDPGEVGMDPRYAARSATGQYRTTPLRGLLQHPPYFHDGSAPTLLAVVEHYDRLFGLNLTAAQKADLVEYLKSL